MVNDPSVWSRHHDPSQVTTSYHWVIPKRYGLNSRDVTKNIAISSGYTWGYNGIYDKQEATQGCAWNMGDVTPMWSFNRDTNESADTVPHDEDGVNWWDSCQPFHICSYTLRIQKNAEHFKDPNLKISGIEGQSGWESIQNMSNSPQGSSRSQKWPWKWRSTSFHWPASPKKWIEKCETRMVIPWDDDKYLNLICPGLQLLGI